MEGALRLTTMVQPGGSITVTDSHLPAGKQVEVIVLFRQLEAPVGRSIADVLADAPGHLMFQNADEVDSFLNEEKNSWER